MEYKFEAFIDFRPWYKKMFEDFGMKIVFDFLTYPGNVSLMFEATKKERPALEGILPELNLFLKKNFEKFEKNEKFKQICGSIVAFIMMKNDFVALKPKTMRAEKNSFFKTSMMYRKNEEVVSVEVDETFEEILKVVSQYMIHLKGFDQPVTIKIYKDLEKGFFLFDQSHLVQTPANSAAPYRTSLNVSPDEKTAFNRALSALKRFIYLAQVEGHKPSPAWLVPNPDFY